MEVVVREKGEMQPARRVRVELDRAPGQGQRQLELAVVGQVACHQPEHDEVARLQLRGTAQLGDSPIDVPREQRRQPQRRVGHHVGVVQRHRALAHPPRADQRIVLAVGLVPAVVVLVSVQVGEPRQAFDVVGLDLDDALQALAGGEVDLGDVRVRVLQVVVGAEHAVVAAQVLRRLAPRAAVARPGTALPASRLSR